MKYKLCKATKSKTPHENKKENLVVLNALESITSLLLESTHEKSTYRVKQLLLIRLLQLALLWFHQEY